MTLSLILKAAFVVTLLLAAYTDARKLLIPNAYPAIVILLFIVAQVAGFDFSAPLWSHLLHFAIALAVGMVLFRFGWFGGGDAKLYAAVALWFGIGDAILLLFITSVAGAVIVLGRMMLRVFGIGSGRSEGGAAVKVKASERRIAYGVAIAVGGILAMYFVYPETPPPPPSLLAAL